MKKSTAPKRMVNLGCGLRTTSDPRFINVDWSLGLRISQCRKVLRLLRPLVPGDYLERLQSVRGTVLLTDLSRGLPFHTNSLDFVYHSHFLEHIDRSEVSQFLSEVLRVMAPGGIHRICIPDFQVLSANYLEAYHLNRSGCASAADVEAALSRMLEQSVRRESAGLLAGPRLLRLADRFVRGDARRRGETHQWMYDEITLEALLKEVGFVDRRRMNWRESQLPNWCELGLEEDLDGNEYKPGSLYFECRKPL